MELKIPPNTLLKAMKMSVGAWQIFNFSYPSGIVGAISKAADEILKEELKKDTKALKKFARNETKLHRYSPSDAGRLARKTAEVIRDRPWIQGHLENEDGICALGALNLTVSGRTSSNGHLHPLVEYTRRVFAKWNGDSIEWFNDCVAKTKEDVIEILLKFADNFDVKGSRKEQ